MLWTRIIINTKMVRKASRLIKLKNLESLNGFPGTTRVR